MATIELTGRINETGDLEIAKPSGLRVGIKVKVTITELDEAIGESDWTQDELQELMKPSEPKPGAEIAAWLRANPDTGGWAEMDIPDVAEWVRQLRREASTRRENE